MQDWMQNAATQAAVDAPVVSDAPSVVPGRVLHIDGDMIAYWAGGNEDTSVQVSRNTALNKIEAMGKYAGAERIVVHLTAESSSKADRYLIATVKPYQGQRKGKGKPQNWAYLRSWMESYEGHSFSVKLWATREADDGLAWMAYLYGGEHVICTKDKDMRMLPGWHQNWDTMALHYVPRGCYDLVHDDKQYGHKWFWLQMLHGDGADNIPGLPKIRNGKGNFVLCGEVGAKNALLDTTCNAEACNVVAQAYRDYYDDDAGGMMMAEQALLLWLRTDKACSLYDVLKITGESLRPAIAAIESRVKGMYAEAHRLTGVSPTRQDA
jgi:DNA polymerase-1